MKYTVSITNEFKKAYKKCEKRGLDMRRLDKLIDSVSREGFAPPEMRPHKLSGSHAGLWECHVGPDWLAVWRQDDDNLLVEFVSTGSHSDLY